MAGRTIIDYTRTNTTNIDIVRVEDSIHRFTHQLASNGLLAGNIIGPFSLAAGVTQEIPHGLGRRWAGWLVVDQDAATVVYRDPASTANTLYYVPLMAAVNVNIYAYVF